MRSALSSAQLLFLGDTFERFGVSFAVHETARFSISLGPVLSLRIEDLGSFPHRPFPGVITVWSVCGHKIDVFGLCGSFLADGNGPCFESIGLGPEDFPGFRVFSPWPKNYGSLLLFVFLRHILFSPSPLQTTIRNSD